MSAMRPEEQAGLEYHQLHRLGRQGWWWSPSGAWRCWSFFVVIGPVLVTVPVASC